jgi:choline dehydrogenase-like flavoprotein
MIMIPVMAIRQIGNPQYDWNHKTIAQVCYGRFPGVPDPEFGDAQDSQQIKQIHAHNSSIGWPRSRPRSRGLGGSSASNFEIYIPGRDADYDAWETLGNKGRGSKDMLK